jgi:glycosyltransferase involved in cell wall biosynthesis
MAFPKKLLIVGRVAHFWHLGQFHAYTPYVREIDIWADLFEEISIAGTLRQGPPPNDCSPFGRQNITVLPVSETGGDDFKAKFLQLFALPKIVAQLVTYMRRAEAIHARCPSDLGLLASMLAPLFTPRLIAKYAGQWSPFPNEPLAWRLQRGLLRSNWWRGPVTVYSGGSEVSLKVVPFFTSMLTEEQIARARIAAAKRRDPDCFRVLFVGRLSKARNVDVLLRAFQQINVTDRKLECVIVGEGPEKSPLEGLATQIGIGNRTKFLGGLRFEDVLDWYESSNVLVLAGDSEGWGKAVTEAMAFGCVCIGGDRGVMPQILDNGRGLVVPPRDMDALRNALQFIADHPAEAAAMSECAAIWAQRFSLDGMRKALRDLMVNSWERHDPVEQIVFLR